MHGEIFSVDDRRETELRHATNVGRSGRAILGDDGRADVDEPAMGNGLKFFGLYVEFGDDLRG